MTLLTNTFNVGEYTMADAIPAGQFKDGPVKTLAQLTQVFANHADGTTPRHIVISTDIFDDVDDLAALAELRQQLTAGNIIIDAVVVSNPRYQRGYVDFSSLSTQDQQKKKATIALAKAVLSGTQAFDLLEPKQQAEVRDLIKSCKGKAPQDDNPEVRAQALKQIFDQWDLGDKCPPILDLGAIGTDGKLLRREELMSVISGRLLEKCCGYIEEQDDGLAHVVDTKGVALAGDVFAANRTATYQLSPAQHGVSAVATDDTSYGQANFDALIAKFEEAANQGYNIDFDSIGSFVEPVKLFRILWAYDRLFDGVDNYEPLVKHLKFSSYMGFSVLQKTTENNAKLSPEEAEIFFNECIDDHTVGVLADCSRMKDMKVIGLYLPLMDENGFFNPEQAREKVDELKKNETAKQAIWQEEIARIETDIAVGNNGSKELLKKLQKDLAKSQQTVATIERNYQDALQRTQNPEQFLPAEEWRLVQALRTNGQTISDHIFAQPKFFRMLAYMHGEEYLKDFTRNYRLFMQDTEGKYADFMLHDVFNTLVGDLYEQIKKEGEDSPKLEAFEVHTVALLHRR